jgi:predicted RNA-binding Zn ribbon-like protein
MTNVQAPPPLLAESRGLDFLNSLATPNDGQVEWLADGDQLLAWLEAAVLVDSAVLDKVRTSAKPGELDAAAAQARALREWFRDFVAKHRGKQLTRRALAELEPLNRLLARDAQFSQIALQAKGDGEGSVATLKLLVQRRWPSPDALLYPVAEALAHLVTSADFTDVKHCEGPNCTLHFLDTTRDRRRRWCSMAVCGNRAKQAAHRLRKATDS